jgi:tetratricopeptide (TPR) repeat protein
MMKRISVLLLLLSIGLGLSGCSRDPNVKKQKYFKSGQSYLAKGDYRNAMIEFSNAIQVDGGFVEAHYQLAETFLKMEQWPRAFQELSRTVELKPDHYPAQIALANLQIAAHTPESLQQASDRVTMLLQQQPNNAEVHSAAANLLAAQQKLPEAIAEMQKAIVLDPNVSNSYMALAVLQMEAQQPDAAEANFKKAIALDPKSVTALLALGGYYQNLKRYSDADQEFRAAIQAAPKDPAPRSAMVRLLLNQGKTAEAEDFLRQTKRDMNDVPVGYRMLGDYYFGKGDLDKATTEFASLHQDHPKDSDVTKTYVELLILKNRLDEAQKLDDEILKINPNDDAGLLLRGQMQMQGGKPNDAVTTLQGALKSNPDNARAHYELGLAYQQLGNLTSAQSEWQQATNMAPNMLDAWHALGAAQLRSGDNNAVEKTADRLIALQPNAADGYNLRAVANINRRAFPAAESDINQAIKLSPQQPNGYIQMGNLRMAQRQFPQAGAAYQQGLDRDPGSVDALGGVMNAYLAQKQPDKALAAVKAQIAKKPDVSGFYDMLGTVLASQRDFAGAEDAFKQAVGLNKNSLDALMKLARVQVARGSVDAAISSCEDGLKNNPQSASLYLMTGELYEAEKKLDNARQMYEKALQIQPEMPMASNNLAYVLLQTGGSVDVALSLAQAARRGMPDSPNAADTLGWVFYQKGSYQTAVDLFKESLRLREKAKQPEDATVYYHLGLAYAKLDQPDLARQQLEHALQVNPQSSDAEDIRKQLAQLKS